MKLNMHFTTLRVNVILLLFTSLRNDAPRRRPPVAHGGWSADTERVEISLGSISHREGAECERKNLRLQTPLLVSKLSKVPFPLFGSPRSLLSHLYTPFWVILYSQSTLLICHPKSFVISFTSNLKYLWLLTWLSVLSPYLTRTASAPPPQQALPLYPSHPIWAYQCMPVSRQ